MATSEFGRIGRDAELRYTPNGDAVCNIAVAVDYGRKGQDGKRPTQWYDLALWGKQAEGLAPYLLKGKQIFFTASELHIEQFNRADGTQGAKLVGRISEIKFASDGGQAGQGVQPQPARPAAPRPQPAQQPATDLDSFDDDIPF